MKTRELSIKGKSHSVDKKREKSVSIRHNQQNNLEHPEKERNHQCTNNKKWNRLDKKHHKMSPARILINTCFHTIRLQNSTLLWYKRYMNRCNNALYMTVGQNPPAAQVRRAGCRGTEKCISHPKFLSSQKEI